ncbi:Na+/H+ antiporter NhaC family protein [Ammoniphilus sp. YIM 78166]|uniref:Na+/H+ antiporter NhaC family protein n=1 Tax=Ammoniphilus sp. YIM 78166 TaxID=1644106 RepID=UPI00142F9C8A|nr:Na+/H+ antiporter NhaC family protein [Ammoniphilus sp. YIM 78166]
MLKPLTLIFLIFCTIGGMLLSSLFGLPLALGFLLGLTVLVLLCRRMGAAWSDVWEGTRSGAYRTKEVLWILALVGLLIPSWMASGTIPYLIDWGLSLVEPAYFLCSAFLLSTLTSMALGTSIGTLSTIGLPLMGAATILDLPLAMVGGALISGAMVGDRSSPLSSAHQLLAATTETDIQKQSKAMLPTTLGGIVLSCLFFYAWDLQGQLQVEGKEVLDYSFEQQFFFHPLLMLPPLILIGMILLRIKTKYAFVASILASLIIGNYWQGVGGAEWWRYLLHGFDGSSLSILHSKGLLDMTGMIVFIACTGAFNGLLEKHRVIEPYIQQMMGNKTNLTKATCTTSLFGLVMNMLCCNQTLPIMISGRNLLPIWRVRYSGAQLSRVLSDTSLLFAALIPWNILAMLAATIMGVPVTDYLPYAPFLWLMPILTIALSYYYDLQWKRTQSKGGNANEKTIARL